MNKITKTALIPNINVGVFNHAVFGMRNCAINGGVLDPAQFPIIKLNRRHIEQLAIIDFESEHQGDRERDVKLSDMRKGIQNRFDKGHEIFFGYKQNNELVGYVTLKPFFPGYKHCEVYWLAVKKKCQGQGLGTKLMKFIENYAKKNGFRKICLYTGQNMKLTRKFYEKIGYKLINEFPGYYGYPTGNTTAVLYAKSL